MPHRRPQRAEGTPAAGEAPADGARPPRRFNREARPAEAGERPQGQAPNRPRFDKPLKSFNDDKKPFDGKKFAGKRGGDRNDDWKQHRPRDKRETPLDPDSPWAALAALRNPKPE